MKKCPFCAEEIQDEAIICKHCKKDLNTPPVQTVVNPENAVSCNLCGGLFVKKTFATNTAGGLICLISGFLFLFFFWPLGVILLIVGLVLDSQSKSYLVCNKCGNKVERHRKWFEFS